MPIQVPHSFTLLVPYSSSNQSLNRELFGQFSVLSPFNSLLCHLDERIKKQPRGRECELTRAEPTLSCFYFFTGSIIMLMNYSNSMSSTQTPSTLMYLKCSGPFSYPLFLNVLYVAPPTHLQNTVINLNVNLS